ncbi:MAG: hypothetical protein JXB13_14690, partial [Phycisphaerae bacterium]|nr:hypothetical protein [Phycisphaerae bacterium]
SCMSALRARPSVTIGLVCLVVAPAARARRPVQPLPAGIYTFDQGSPTVSAGFLSAADVLRFSSVDPTLPIVDVNAADVGLTLFDDIDALSINTTGVGPIEPLLLVFSVDRYTTGIAPPEPSLVAQGVPFNVYDQAARGHAAADQYLSTEPFTRSGVVPLRGERQVTNNTLIRNNFDEGGTGHGAQPQRAADINTNAEPQDNVDAVAAEQIPGLRTRPPLYLSLTPDSPTVIQTGTSGAHIFYLAEPNMPLSLFAAPEALGLTPLDDIDALVVFDMNENGVFDGSGPTSDQVLFSLAPGSPSLSAIPDASNEGAAADVFSVHPGSPPTITVLASAAQLGLGAIGDNVDALHFIRSATPMQSALRHGIRERIPCDYDNDSDVDHKDLTAWVVDCQTGPDIPGTPEPLTLECLLAFDTTGDERIDLADFAAFQRLFTGIILP